MSRMVDTKRRKVNLSDAVCSTCLLEAPCACVEGGPIRLCDTCDGTRSGKREVDWTGEQYGPCTCPSVPEARRDD